MMASGPDADRSLRLIHRAIEAFGLDLTGLNVLTEAATGPFVFTPLVAALAGAESVAMLSRDSRFGTARDAVAAVVDLAERWGVSSRLTALPARDDARLEHAQVVTNLGFVRPIDRALLGRLAPTAAVALMFETWEHRREDVDLVACRELGIPVLGTNEDDERLRTFDYLPMMAAKLLLDLEVEVVGSRLVLVSSGKFARYLRDGLVQMGASVTTMAPPIDHGAAGFTATIAEADALIIADHPGTSPILGPAARCTAADLYALNPGIGIAHIAGEVDAADLAGAELRHAPQHIAAAGFMSVTAGHLGPRPVIDLHTAGLKVGEALCRARLDGLSGAEAENSVLDTLPLAQGFSARTAAGAP